MVEEYVTTREFQQRHEELQKLIADLTKEVTDLTAQLNRLIGSLTAYKIVVPVLTALLGIAFGLLLGKGF